MPVVLMLLLLLLSAPPAQAVLPDEMLPDATLESRARTISQDLRCLVCQNQSIDDSNAPLARDLRLLVRERLRAGDSDAAAVAYIQARYGDFVLLRPPFQANTLILWLGPFAVLALALGGVGLWLRRRRSAPIGAETPLSAEERARLARLLEDQGSR